MHPYRVRDVEELRDSMAASKRTVPHTVRSLAHQVGANRTTIGYLMTGVQTGLSRELAERLSVELQRPMSDLFVPASSANADIDGGSNRRADGARDER